jgi:feruloyl esterase
MRRFFVLLGLAAGFSGLAGRAGRAEPGACESLGSSALGNATVTRAETIGAGVFTAPSGGRAGGGAEGQRFDGLPSFCRVTATLTPSRDSDIRMEMWLPTSGWNGKFQAVGNGGWAGAISYGAMAEALKAGYATASTDTGHVGATGSFVLGHPEKYIDFGYRAVHEMTATAKAIIAAHYQTAARRSYWNGCSTGGRQGLMEAQRFPADYDGIIAGAAANPRTTVNAFQLSLSKMLLQDDASFIPPAKYRLLHEAVVSACDRLDGVKDGLISDPTRCHFDPKTLQCPSGDGSVCLSANQVASARALFAPFTNPVTGLELLPGYEPGSELDLADPRAFGSSSPILRSVDLFAYLVFGDPKWDWRTFDADRDLRKAQDADHGIADVTTADLREFGRRGGKLLMYHGWADGAIPPRTSINYFQGIVNAAGGAAAADSWVRLFMVPGMHHCTGGEGPATFDAVGALDTWIEQGTAPDRIIAAQVVNGHVGRTRPLCPYPQIAQYKGTGSGDDSVSFVCRVP